MRKGIRSARCGKARQRSSDQLRAIMPSNVWARKSLGVIRNITMIPAREQHFYLGGAVPEDKGKALDEHLHFLRRCLEALLQEK